MTRWKKVARDLWLNRSRTVLVVLSIAVGVFAIGMIASAQQALTESLNEQYAALRPADAVIRTAPALDDDFVAAIRHLRGVDEAEGRRSLLLRLSPDGEGETWRDIGLYAIPDYDNQRLFRVWKQTGTYPREKGEVYLERATMEFLNLKKGDEILIKSPNGKKFHLRVAGSVHDLYRMPPVMEGWLYGYVGMDTIRWMGEPEGYNELYVDVHSENEEDIRVVADEVADRIEGEGLPIFGKTLPDTARHPLNFVIETTLILLGLLAALSMILSALLVVNVISALIAQQERQIGVMKAIGARAYQIVGLYFGMVLFLGALACLIAIPFGALGANALASFTAGLINFDAPQVEVTAQALLFQFGVGLIVPLIAAAYPILSGSKISPARVLSEYGISQKWKGAGAVDSILKRFPAFTRDILFSFRNPFRKRGRLVLSLLTLTFAGAVFMGIIHLQRSLDVSLEEMFRFWSYDAWLILDDYYPADRLVNETTSVDGVLETEVWDFTVGRYVRPDGTESADLYLMAPPVGTTMLNPPIIAGRALRKDDVNAILVTPGFINKEREAQLGKEIAIKIEGREEKYRIVGVMQMMGNAALGYMTVMSYDDFAAHVREPNRANTIVFTMNTEDLETQRLIASEAEARFDRADIETISNFLVADERLEIDAAFAIVIALLLTMTVVLALVGGLGLMGTMSLNVIERTREIGVMRSFGASSRAIFRVVILEGLSIGMMSWFFAIWFSFPIGIFLSRIVGLSFMDYPLTVSVSINGILIWAAMVVVISVLASVVPALRAVRLTVTQVLAYE